LRKENLKCSSIPGLRIELTNLKCEFFNGVSLFRIAINVAGILQTTI
jgi:hypothetical protein